MLNLLWLLDGSQVFMSFNQLKLSCQFIGWIATLASIKESQPVGVSPTNKKSLDFSDGVTEVEVL